MEVQIVIKYLNVIRKWWWVIILLCVTTVGTMLAIAALTETEYEAVVSVQITAPPPQEVPLYSQFGRQALQDEIIQTRDRFSELLLEGDSPRLVLDSLPDVWMTVDELYERITVEPSDSSNLLLRVSVRASNPETAALLANTLVEVGLDQYGELLAGPTANTRQFIELELNAAQVQLEEAELELAQFKIDNKVGDLNRAIDSLYSLIRSLRLQSDLAQAEGKIVESESLQKIILEREAELQNMIGLLAEYNRLVNSLERASTTHDFLLDKKTEAQIKENQIRALESIQVITPARPPRWPISVINDKLIVLGAIGSILAGVLLTFLLEYLEISGVFRNVRGIPEQSNVVVS